MTIARDPATSVALEGTTLILRGNNVKRLTLSWCMLLALKNWADEATEQPDHFPNIHQADLRDEILAQTWQMKKTGSRIQFHDADIKVGATTSSVSIAHGSLSLHDLRTALAPVKPQPPGSVPDDDNTRLPAY
jgi:hypothetical protein